MDRYKQRFNGVGKMSESDTGDWVKYHEFEALLEQHDDALFGVIKERNEEITQLQETRKTLGNDTIKANCVNNELYAMLIISSVLNFIAIIGITLFVFGKI